MIQRLLARILQGGISTNKTVWIVAIARKDYNESVQAYNTSIRSLPTSIIAGPMGFGPKEYFKSDEGAKQVPQVKF
ncbi:LemA family protein [Sporomusa carbonis]|uniref:LemA family protein n=1 Tax=Sporomusa carbonis TaxID=3076075 RepID=UPI003C7A9045